MKDLFKTVSRPLHSFSMTVHSTAEAPPLHTPALLVARYLPLHAAVYAILAFLKHPGWLMAVVVGMVGVAAMAAIHWQAARIVAFVGCIGVAIVLFPDVPNHGYLFCFALGLGALFRVEDQDERTTYTQGLQYLAAIVLFWSGVQKLLAGTWTRGQLLAYEIGHEARFDGVLGWLEERATRLTFRTTGPFVASAPLTVVSNAIWILEIVLGLALLSSRAHVRRGAAIATMIMIVGIEVAARESIFGILMMALLLPALDLQFRSRWLWLLVPVELLAIGGRLSLVPGGFH